MERWEGGGGSGGKSERTPSSPPPKKNASQEEETAILGTLHPARARQVRLRSGSGTGARDWRGSIAAVERNENAAGPGLRDMMKKKGKEGELRDSIAVGQPDSERSAWRGGGEKRTEASGQK